MNKLGKDFNMVIKCIWQLTPQNHINPFRCHEIAYLISKGLNYMGHETRTQDGQYHDNYNWYDHTWVVAKSTILDYVGYKEIFPGAYSENHTEVVRPFWRKWNYTPKKVEYHLAKGIDEFAELVLNQIRKTAMPER